LARADALYHRSEAGIACLPSKVRPAMFAARHIYCAIGNSVRANGFDNISVRARTTKAAKLRLLGLSAAYSMASTFMPTPATVYAPPLPQTEFLVRAAGIKKRVTLGWSERFVSVMEQLHEHDKSNIGA
jgi:phytoene synthase